MPGPLKGSGKFWNIRSNLRLYPVNFGNKLCILIFIILSIWLNFFDPPLRRKTFWLPPSGNSKLFWPLRSLQFRYLPQCVVRVWDLTSLAVVLSSTVVNNDYQRNCDDLETIRDGLARHGNVKEMRVAVSNEIWTESQRIVLPSPNFQHA